jgi:hypothetical protein
MGNTARENAVGSEKKLRIERRSKERATSEVIDLYAPHGTGIRTYAWYLLIASVLAFGWLTRGEEYFTAESGTGYYLGIIGASAMVLLLLYPLRKTKRFMRGLGPIKYWFKAHMILGILGPVLVLYHANFQLGSMNSRVVLFASLLVAGSGLFGRYFYTKVHYGLYGRKACLLDLKNLIEDDKGAIKRVLDYAPKLQERLFRFDDLVVSSRYSLIGSAIHGVKVAFTARWVSLVLSRQLRRTLKVAARREKWSAAERKSHARESRRHIKAHINAGVKVAGFNIFERLMSLWHIFHMPFFILLIVVAVIHIVAVHMY